MYSLNVTEILRLRANFAAAGLSPLIEPTAQPLCHSF
eukprot:COSAG06_NODE_57849_length_279_cov_0.572222_1_plen_36_part_01